MKVGCYDKKINERTLLFLAYNHCLRRVCLSHLRLRQKLNKSDLQRLKLQERNMALAKELAALNL